MHLVTSARALANAVWQAPTASCTSCTCACRTSAVADSYCDTDSVPAQAADEPALLERVLPLLLLLPCRPEELLPLPLPLRRPDSAPGRGVRGLVLLLELLPCWLAPDAFGLLLLAPALSALRPTGGNLPAGVLLPCCCLSPVMLP
jgi:hypothetical protein